VHWWPLLTSPLTPGVNLAPRGNVHPFVRPQGCTFSTVYLEEWRGKQRILLPRDNFTPGVKVCP
jgi:hypothetical protein